MHGYGVFTWPVKTIFYYFKDGKKYIGQYINDKKEGYGEFYWPGTNNYKFNQID